MISNSQDVTYKPREATNTLVTIGVIFLIGGLIATALLYSQIGSAALALTGTGVAVCAALWILNLYLSQKAPLLEEASQKPPLEEASPEKPHVMDLDLFNKRARFSDPRFVAQLTTAQRVHLVKHYALRHMTYWEMHEIITKGDKTAILQALSPDLREQVEKYLRDFYTKKSNK